MLAAMSDATFAVDSGRLNYRVVGVCIHEGHVLLHREAKDDFWVLPGGRPLLHEASRDTIVREMAEEIDTRVEVGRLLWVVENFFAYAGQAFHEIALYFAIALPEDSAYRDVTSDFIGREGEIALLFHWFPLARLAEIDLYPTFLKTALTNLPEAPVHVIHYGK
jgi:ADP-ribose pyrophosphatase YjhB (NUDIX family)